MLSLLVSMALSQAPLPPIPPPDADRLAAATALWRVRPVPEREGQAALDAAIVQLGSDALTRAGVAADRHHHARLYALAVRLAARAAAARALLDERAVTCLATGLAYTLPAEDLASLGAFVATESGGRFWDYYSHWGLVECYRHHLGELVAATMDEDVRASRRAR